MGAGSRQSHAPTDYDTIQSAAASSTVKIDQPALFSLVNGTVAIRGTAAGDGFQSFRLQIGEGLNPKEWVEIVQNTIPILDSQLGEWDTSGKNGLFAIRLLVLRDDNRIETALSQVTVDSIPPLASILNPQEGVSVSGVKPVFLQADVSDTSGINRVEWQIDGKPIGESQQIPYTFEWTAPLRGTHKLTVTATDAAGNLTVSTPLTFIVE